MGAVIPAGFAQVNLLLQHVSATHVGEIVYGIDVTDAAAPMADVADFCTHTYEDTFGVRTDAGVRIGRSIIHLGGTPPYLQVDGVYTGGGARTMDCLNSAGAVLMRKRSVAVAGRGGRGRNYLPWLAADSEVDDVGIIGPTAVGNFQSDAEDWLAAHAAGGGGVGPVPVVILHSVGGSTATDIPAPVDQVSVDELIATQRRRLGR